MADKHLITLCSGKIKQAIYGIGLCGGMFTGMLWNKILHGKATSGEGSNWSYGILLFGSGILAYNAIELAQYGERLGESKFKSLQDKQEFLGTFWCRRLA